MMCLVESRRATSLIETNTLKIATRGWVVSQLKTEYNGKFHKLSPDFQNSISPTTDNLELIQKLYE